LRSAFLASSQTNVFSGILLQYIYNVNNYPAQIPASLSGDRENDLAPGVERSRQ